MPGWLPDFGKTWKIKFYKISKLDMLAYAWKGRYRAWSTDAFIVNKRIFSALIVYFGTSRIF